MVICEHSFRYHSKLLPGTAQGDPRADPLSSGQFANRSRTDYNRLYHNATLIADEGRCERHRKISPRGNLGQLSMTEPIQYNSTQKQLIHELLDKVFTVHDLDQFAAAYFQDAGVRFTRDMGKATKIQTLIEACAQQEQIPQLIAKIKQAKPVEFEAFARRAQGDKPEAPSPEPTSASLVSRRARSRSSTHTLIHNPERLISRSLDQRYRLDEILDRSGLGAVFKAYDTKLRRVVAIKLIDLTRVNQPALKERVRQEVRTAMQLDHPGVVTIYDFGQSDFLLYIIMEYISGQNLDEVRQRFDALQPDTVLPQKLQLIRQIALTIDYMHQQGVLHPGTKPENIMLKPGQTNQGRSLAAGAD